MSAVYDGKREIRLLLVVCGVALVAYGALGIATGRVDLGSSLVTLAIGAFVVGAVVLRGDVLAS